MYVKLTNEQIEYAFAADICLDYIFRGTVEPGENRGLYHKAYVESTLNENDMESIFDKGASIYVHEDDYARLPEELRNLLK